MVVKYIEDLDKKLLNDLLAIDSRAYPKHLQETFAEVNSKFLVNRDMYVLLYDDDKLVGYLCLFPIREELYEKIVNNNRPLELSIPGNFLDQYVPFKTYRLYILSAVIDPEYQMKGLSKYLIEGFYRYVLNKKNNNIFFSAALATAVTTAGETMLKKMHFKKQRSAINGHTLYELSIDENYYKAIEGFLYSK